MSQLTVQEINDFAELAPLRPAWEALLDQTAGASFFQTLDWLTVYWQHYGAQQQLRTLVVSEGSEPIGIVPLVVRHEQRKVGLLETITYPMDDWGSFYGPLGPAPQRTLEAALGHLNRGRRDWDLIDLRWAGSHANLTEHTHRALDAVGLAHYRSQRAVTAVVDLDGTWEQYLARKSSKWRNNLRRWERRLKELGELTYLRYRPRGTRFGEDDPRWDLYDTCEEVARRSWQGSSQTGTTLTHESVRPFLRDAHMAAIRAGAAEMILMRLDGRPLAFAYNYCHRGYVFGLRIGYDGEISRQGVGNVLYRLTIEDSFRRGDTLYDLGAGSLDAKKYYLTRQIEIDQFSHYRPGSMRAQLMRLKHWADTLRGAPAAKGAKSELSGAE